jgi:hypothetical protein
VFHYVESLLILLIWQEKSRGLASWHEIGRCSSPKIYLTHHVHTCSHGLVTVAGKGSYSKILSNSLVLSIGSQQQQRLAGIQSSSQPHIAGGGAGSGSVAAVAGAVPVQQNAPQIARETPPTSPGNQRRRNLSETYTQVPGAVAAALQQQQSQRPPRYGYT